MLDRAWNALAAVCSWIAATDPSGAGLRGWRRAAWEFTATVWVFLTFAVKWRVFRRRRRQRREQPPRGVGVRGEPTAVPASVRRPGAPRTGHGVSSQRAG